MNSNVDGEVLKSDVIRFQMMGSNDSYAREMVAAHPAGKRVDVFYNPARILRKRCCSEESKAPISL